jgi:hypothetical protein
MESLMKSGADSTSSDAALFIMRTAKSYHKRRPFKQGKSTFLDNFRLFTRDFNDNNGDGYSMYAVLETNRIIG